MGELDKRIWTNGCFDLVHPGHVALLQEARRQLGGPLWVAINSDASVERVKGPGRPFLKAKERAFLLRALECVDGVIEFNDSDFTNSIRLIRPGVYFKSSEYSLDTINVRERIELEKIGARVEFIGRSQFSEFSTTLLESWVKNGKRLQGSQWE